MRTRRKKLIIAVAAIAVIAGAARAKMSDEFGPILGVFEL
jgi:hypothetical protein